MFLSANGIKKIKQNFSAKRLWDEFRIEALHIITIF